MYVMPKKINPALRNRAVRLVREHRSECPSLKASSAAVARQIGVGQKSVRRSALLADIHDGIWDGVTCAEHVEIQKLKAENTSLREDVAILRAATSFFVGKSSPSADDDGFHRHDEIPVACGRVALAGAAGAGPPDLGAHPPSSARPSRLGLHGR